MTKFVLYAALLAMASVSVVAESEADWPLLRLRSQDQNLELIRAHRVLKGKGKGKGSYSAEFSMSFDLSYPASKQALPKKKSHDASKKGMSKLPKAPTSSKASKASKGGKGSGKGNGKGSGKGGKHIKSGKGSSKGYKEPKMDELFPDMSMSMETTAAPSVMDAPPSAGAPAASPSAPSGVDTQAPVA